MQPNQGEQGHVSQDMPHEQDVMLADPWRLERRGEPPAEAEINEPDELPGEAPGEFPIPELDENRDDGSWEVLGVPRDRNPWLEFRVP